MGRTLSGAWSRRRTRGAIFVEACIVISSFVLLFLSMVFFRNVYLRKIQVARLARATVIAYSMQGCPDGNADAWAKPDLDPNASKSTPGPTQTQTGAPTQTQTGVPVPATEKTHSKRADAIMGEIPGAGSNGGQLNPIADLGFSMKAAATTPSGPLGARRGYSRTMSSTSYVSCAEGIRGDSFSDVMHYALDRFHLTKGSCPPPDPNAPPPQKKSCEEDDADP